MTMGGSMFFWRRSGTLRPLWYGGIGVRIMFDLDGDQKIIAVVDPSRPCYHIPNGFACTYDDDTVAILDLCNVGYLVLE